MSALSSVLPYLGFLLLCVLGGVAFAMLRDASARRGVAAAQRGRAVTVPVLVGSGDAQRRARAYVDGDDVVVIGPRTHLRVGRTTFRDAGARRQVVDDELLDFAEQRGFVDASGQHHLVGALDEWGPAFDAQLDRPASRAGRWRRVRAALPTVPLALIVLSVLAFAAFQGLWAMGRDVDATMVRAVEYPEDGYTDCGVRWPDSTDGSVLGGYAEVDCYEPYPAVGDTVPIRVLAFPFEGSALDRPDSYDALSVVTAVPGVLSLLALGGITLVRLRRPPIRLGRLAIPEVRVAPTVEVAADADLLTLLDALAVKEGWDRDGTGSPPDEPAYRPLLIALGSARWWPAVVLGAAALLVFELPMNLRYGLGAGAVAALLWALVQSVGTLLTVRRAYAGPVTSEWDYSLVRGIDDEWCALLTLGRNPHWLVYLAGPNHPPVRGRCGVRGELVDGGAIHLRIAGEFWPTDSPVVRMDDEILADIVEDVGYRLGPAGGRTGRPGTGPVG
ncbi:hypothetical protein LL946_08505 [Knoellia locipacati]|uniref:hypothetical protein n=1 Tax=Knoellia locipacati TaxID=882824 RepID=UPI00384C8024